MEWIARYWIETVFALVTGCIMLEYKKVIKRLKEQESLKLGVQALLRDRIYQAHIHYMEKEYCPIYARENVEELMKQYLALGGNGVVSKLMKDIFNLPTKKENGK